MSANTKTDVYRHSCLLASGLLMAWYFFDATLSGFQWFQNLDIEKEQYFAYILLVLILFFYFEYLLETLNKGQKLDRKDSLKISVTSLIVLCSPVIAYPKLVTETILSDSSRADLSIGIILGILTGILAVFLRVSIEQSIVFFSFRKKLLPSQALEISFLFILALAAIFSLNILDNSIFPIRHLVFSVCFLATFYLLTPKKKLYGDSEMDELRRKHELLERQQEISQYSSKKSFPFNADAPAIDSKLRKKVIRAINKLPSDISFRVQLKIELHFVPDGDYFKVDSEGLDDSQAALTVSFIDKETGSVISSTDVKLKYVKESCKLVKRGTVGNDLRGFLTPMAAHAYDLQFTLESRAEDLAYKFSSEGNLPQLKKIVKTRNPDLNLRQDDGYTPLLIATANGRHDVVKYLLQQAADTDSETKFGVTPIGFAAKYGDIALCKLLINAKCNINHQDLFGLTPLMLAAMYKHAAVAKLLLDNGANRNIRCDKGKLAVDYAVESKSGTIKNLLLSK